MLTLTSVWGSRKRNPPSPPALDRRALIDQVGGNTSQLRDLIRVYRTESEDALRVLREAVAERDNQQLYAEAAGLRGALGCLHASDAHDAAETLAMIAQEERWSDVEDALGTLFAELERVNAALAEWVTAPTDDPAPSQRFTYATGS